MNQQKTTHNQHRIDIHRALELLSDYYTKLKKLQEKQLIIEIERLIRVLKSRFFQALIDIQEFYEIALMEGMRINNILLIGSQNSINSWTYNKDLKLPENSSKTNELKNVWERKEISIFRGDKGLGFSIAGGVDNPHLPNDFSIYVTKIIPGGTAYIDGQIKVHDIIEKVNDTCITNVTHAIAVETLKKSGHNVQMIIRRRYQQNILKIELSKQLDSFGFSIAGGIGNQHILGDNSIYITKIMEGGAAESNGQLKVGHKIIGIEHPAGFQNLDNVTHEEAVNTLKSTKEKIILYIPN